MKAYKCDRCGVLYERDEEIRINKMYYKIDLYNNVTVRRSIDLCENCRQSFIDWFTEYKEDPHDKSEDR